MHVYLRLLRQLRTNTFSALRCPAGLFVFMAKKYCSISNPDVVEGLKFGSQNTKSACLSAACLPCLTHSRPARIAGMGGGSSHPWDPPTIAQLLQTSLWQVRGLFQGSGLERPPFKAAFLFSKLVFPGGFYILETSQSVWEVLIW